MMRKYLFIGATAFVLGAGSMAYVGQSATAKTTPATREGYRLMQLFADVMDEAKRSYVTDVDEKKMVEAAINGMLQSLDPHSSYLDLAGYGELRDQTRGAYGGLGLEVTSEDGLVKIITPIDETPAARAGLKTDDLITAINGQAVVGMPLNDAVKQMRGSIGEPVTLTIVREKKDPFDVRLVREQINVITARAHNEGEYGYLRVSQFNERTTDEAQRALRQIRAENPNMKGLVLDLRNNPGGLLDQSVSIADMFLDGGEVVSQRPRNPRDIERYNARPGDVLNGLPMVVLINSGSASASEIVAGALQDRKRAEIIGTTSFGKGSVQSVIPLRGGQDGALKLTTGRYYTPSGRSIQKTGIEPDLEVAVSQEEAKKIAEGANRFTEAMYATALDAQEGKVRRGAHEPAEAPPAEFKVEIDFRNSKGDFQLLRALDVLKHGSVAATPKYSPSGRLAEAPRSTTAAAAPTAR